MVLIITKLIIRDYMKNYTKLQTKFIEDIQSNVTIYKHNKTSPKITLNLSFLTPLIKPIKPHQNANNNIGIK